MTLWQRYLILCGLLCLIFILPACSDDDGDEGPTDPGDGDTPDTEAPTVIETMPMDGAMGADNFGQIFITFDEPMDPDSADGQISMSHGTILNQEWMDDLSIMIDHDGWPMGTQVSVTVGTGLADLAGNQLEAPYVFSFWTMADELIVLEHTPATGATNVNRATPIDLFFSASMTSSTFEAGITISDDTKALYPFTVEEVNSYRYRLRPNEPLSASNLITVTIGTEVQSSAGSLAEPYVFTFTTGEVVDNTPPTIVSTIPPSGSIMPASQSTITVEFSEPIDTIDFSPSRLSGQLGWLLAQSSSEPQFNMDQTILTVPLPDDLPPGLPLMAAFAGYADHNGNVQPDETVWTCTIAGEADPYPVWDGRRWVTEGTWTEGNAGSSTPTNSGEEMVWYEFNARATAGQYERVESYDEWNTLDYYEILDVSAAGVNLIGFAEDTNDNGSFDEFMVSSPLTLVEFPYAAGNTWTGSASVTMPDGTLNVTLAGEVVEQVDLAYDFDGFEVVWTDVWRVELDVGISVGGTSISNDLTTFWFAPGIGLIREIYHEDDLEEDEWSEYDRWMAIDLD